LLLDESAETDESGKVDKQEEVKVEAKVVKGTAKYMKLSNLKILEYQLSQKLDNF
jgi:hypothetical protein